MLADTAANTAAVEKQMMERQKEQERGTPPKQARREGLAERDGERALAESLVIYGMHQIAMELQLSYSVHANKGRPEYAFYSANGVNGNAK